MNKPTALESALLVVSVSRLWRDASLPGEPGRACRNPFRADKKPSFSVWTDSKGRERFKDFADGSTGDAVDFGMKLWGCDRAEACRRIIALAGPSGSRRQAWPRPLPVTRPEPVVHPMPDSLDLSALVEPTDGDLMTIAASRGWTRNGAPAPAALAGLRLAASRGVLKVGIVRDNGTPCRAWFVADSFAFNAQARRMDGELWHGADGVRFKAKSMRGSCASGPVGAGVIADLPRVRLVQFMEGAPDLLAAHGLIAESLPRPGLALDEVVPVCMTGAGQRIHPRALPLFAGKKVVVYPHADGNGAGVNGARVWVRQLHEAGAFVIVRDLSKMPTMPTGGKDAADLFGAALRSGVRVNLFAEGEVSNG